MERLIHGKMNPRGFVFGLICFSYSPWGMANTNTAPHPYFIDAMQAVKENNLPQAKALFEKAQESHYSSPKLFYNLGVVYYKLGMLHQSKSAFLQLEKDKQLNELAFYNLALVELKLNNDQEAFYWLNRVIARNNNPDIQKMAFRLINKIRHESDEFLLSKQPINKTSLLASFRPSSFKSSIKTEVGYNDNIAQYRYINDAINDTSGDNFLFIQADSKLNFRKHVDFMASAYYMAYQKKSYFNSTNLLASANYHNLFSSWLYNIGSSYIRQTSNGIEYQEITRLSLTLERKLGTAFQYKMLVSNDFIRILDDTYQHLGGKQYQWINKLHYFHKYASYSLSYQYEHNSRRNFKSKDNIIFTSFSPRIHKTEIIFSPNIHRKLNANFFANVAYQYHTEKNYVSNNNYSYREDLNYQYGFEIKYALMKNIDISGKYSYAHNESSLILYKYQNRLYQLGMNWGF